MTAQIYPYEDLNLPDLKGEIWDDVPGYDGEYQVSNLGRVKSLRRWRNSGRGGGYYTKERIRLPALCFNKNTYTGEKTYLLSIALKQNGVNHTTSISRYVYYVFVEPFDIANPDIIVSYKDYDGRNVTPKNLFLTDRKKLVQRSVQLGKSYSKWAENKVPVLQMTMRGQLIKRFESISAASLATGYSTTAISACINGNIHQHKGFLWRHVQAGNTIMSKSKNSSVFNDYLWKKIGCPKVSKKKPIPVLNLSPDTLKSECWKNIEGMNGAYKVSSFGRVKSAARFKHNYCVWAKDHIQKLIPDGKTYRNCSSLLVSLSKNGEKFQQSVARLVYFHFVKRFNINDKTIKGGYKNGCFYDLHYSNLYLK